MEEKKIRLQKYMSQAGICSRRKAEEYINAGDVYINGVKALIGQSVDPETDKVTLGNMIVEDKKNHVYYKLNKPFGIITTCSQDGESSILDIVEIPERVFPIGRLDKNSTGLILLTNDGRLSNYLMHPRYEHEKEYIVDVYGKISDEELDDMSEGMFILGKRTRQAEIRRVGSGTFSIILKEGMNRQIRRMVEKTGHQVKRLKRIRVENILIEDMKEGEYRKLTQIELGGLEKRLGIKLG
ncbi:MAG: pseudouridine synthase [Candidatus Gracilibacteria bacterium]|nr:pseudouridine synthase [Candidatus Gracilibacteria bacterium]